MSSQVTRSQVKENVDGVSLTPRWFILNIKVKPTKFICSADSISRRGMVPTRSMNIYDSEHCNVTHPNSCLQVFYHTQSSQKQSNHQYTTFIRYVCRSIQQIDVVMVSKKIGGFFTCSTISTLLNSDVFHEVPGYFKYR